MGIKDKDFKEFIKTTKAVSWLEGYIKGIEFAQQKTKEAGKK